MPFILTNLFSFNIKIKKNLVNDWIKLSEPWPCTIISSPHYWHSDANEKVGNNPHSNI